MDIDFTSYFNKYEQLVTVVDELFSRVAMESPECVSCKPVCSDCCHAIFDLTLIEALYLNRKFHSSISGSQKEAILEKANRADREVYRLKRTAFKSVASGERSEPEVLEALGRERVRCPLLNSDEMCDLYSHRPITCRLYGVPTVIGGKGHVCGLSAFKIGERCPSINIDAIQDRLLELSQTFAMDIGSKYKLSDLLVPLSMALLTDYDETYLGVTPKDTEPKPEGEGS
jgi:Fe-S-cluster containining protein